MDRGDDKTPCPGSPAATVDGVGSRPADQPGERLRPALEITPLAPPAWVVRGAPELIQADRADPVAAETAAFRQEAADWQRVEPPPEDGISGGAIAVPARPGDRRSPVDLSAMVAPGACLTGGFAEPAPKAPMPLAAWPLSVDRADRPKPPMVGGATGYSRETILGYGRKAVKIAALVAGAWLVAIVGLIGAYRFVNPPVSSLMVQQTLSGQSITQRWVNLEDVSPNLVRAVMLSEDGRFCQHHGIDYNAIQDALEKAGEGTPRGASTISQQVVKNLFLWSSRSYLRKALEVPLTYLMELLWPKRRIMEVYLNIAEWGPGIFGVEAASQYHFDKPAKGLSMIEAARLAVALPNPFMRDAGDPGPMTRRLASDIQTRMRVAPASQTTCVLASWRRIIPERARPEAAAGARPKRPPAPEEDAGWETFTRPLEP